MPIVLRGGLGQPTHGSGVRLVSVATASSGSGVTPLPPATICATVERLVARNSLSRAPVREHAASA